jgi:hypothetical protein
MPNDPAARGGASPQPRGRDHLYVTTRQALPLQGGHVGPPLLCPAIFANTLHISHKLCTVTQGRASTCFFTCFFAFCSPRIEAGVELRRIRSF